MDFELNSQISVKQVVQLRQSLKFLHIGELRDICKKLRLNHKGKKSFITECILSLLETGKIVAEPVISKKSISPKGQNVSLAPDSLILKGSYKNDLKTRLFFKNIVGDHFHFTAFGIDWINEKWMEGNPPTYRDYATMWQSEIDRRKKHGSTPKEEWAYINYVQKLIIENPHISKEDILNRWNIIRSKNKKIVYTILGFSNE